jgi:glycosidase
MLTSVLGPEVETVLRQARTPRTKHVVVGDRTIDIPTPFPSPADWRDQWIYFLLVDRFNHPQAPPHFVPYDGLHGVFQGGSFNGVRQKLAYLHHLGVGALWLSPVLKNCQYNPFTYHGYGIQDFLQIDPRFASDPLAARENPRLAEDELRALVDEAHARGMYVIFDIVLNHAGDVFEYVREDGTRSAEVDWRDQPYTINWRDEQGHGRPEWASAPDDPPPDAAVWPHELRRNEYFRRQGKGGEAGGDFASLKELVTAYRPPDAAAEPAYPVRSALIRAYQYLIAKYDIDGFRIDTLKYIEPDFAQSFGNAMREFALGIGKKNFFSFGEVYDSEEQIARFIGRNVATQDTDIIGVDAALDFPLFFKLPSVAKGQLAPTEVIGMFEHRKQVERTVLSSHGEASRFFVSFLDNHDQHERFYFSSNDAPDRFVDQLTLGCGCLFALQGIPCLYYGTEQGLHGRGDTDLAVREALWGKPQAFDHHQRPYRVIQQLAAVRVRQPALRYGRQYFRPLSGDGFHFGVSAFTPGVLAFSRILNEQEVIVVANTSTEAGWTGEVLVDRALNPVGARYAVAFTNKIFMPGVGHGGATPGPVLEKSAGNVEIHEVGGAVTTGPAHAVRVSLERMEFQILSRT